MTDRPKIPRADIVTLLFVTALLSVPAIFVGYLTESWFALLFLLAAPIFVTVIRLPVMARDHEARVQFHQHEKEVEEIRRGGKLPRADDEM